MEDTLMCAAIRLQTPVVNGVSTSASDVGFEPTRSDSAVPAIQNDRRHTYAN